jgi:hypothetical protein
MSSLARFAGLASLLLALPIVGCAASAEPDDQDPATADAAVSSASCGSAKYNQALTHYKAAVAKSKQRARDGACGGDAGEATLADIASEAQKAITTCGDFKKVISTSPWAGALREELRGSLAYPLLTGALDPAKAASVAAALDGATMFGPAPGVYGNVGKLVFEANGRGKMGILILSDDGMPSWGHTDMRWSVESRGGALHVKVVAEYENETEKTFDYLFKKGEDHYGADNYRLELQGDADAPGALQSFDTYPSECEA